MSDVKLIPGKRYRITQVHEGIAGADGDLKLDEGGYLLRSVDPKPVFESIDRLGDPLPTETTSVISDAKGVQRSLQVDFDGDLWWRPVDLRVNSVSLRPHQVFQPVQVLYDAGTQR